MSDKQEPVMQADREFAARWTSIRGEFTELTEAAAAHRLASTNADAERVAELEDALRAARGRVICNSSHPYSANQELVARIDTLLGAKPSPPTPANSSPP